MSEPMNTEFKNIVNTICDSEKMVMHIVKKDYVSLASDAVAEVQDIAADIASASALSSEIQGLSHVANQKDLVDYIESKISTIPELSGTKAKAIYAFVVSIVAAGLAFEQAYETA